MLQENPSIIRALLSAGGRAPAAGPSAARSTALAADIHAHADDKLALTPVDAFRIPVGGQEVALQQVDYAHGGASLLRVRIREGKRFTVFDLDAASARRWGDALVRWAESRER